MNKNSIVFEDNIVYILQETHRNQETFEWMKNKFDTWFKSVLCFNTIALSLVGTYLQIGMPMTPGVKICDYIQVYT